MQYFTAINFINQNLPHVNETERCFAQKIFTADWCYEFVIGFVAAEQHGCEREGGREDFIL